MPAGLLPALTSVLALVLAAGLAGFVRRRPGGALPWTMAVCLLTVPLLTTDFDYRYLLPATPLACVAAALTFGRRPGPVPVPAPSTIVRCRAAERDVTPQRSHR